MPAKTRSTLHREALGYCQRHMNSLIDAKLEVVPEGDGELAWNSGTRRHVYEESFTVWRDFDRVEANVSADGTVRELKIHGRFARAEDLVGSPKLTEDQALEIAETTGLLGDTAMVEELREEASGMAVAKVIQIEHALPRSISITINPKTKQVAAYKVMDAV